jgi:hypothetical protein
VTCLEERVEGIDAVRCSNHLHITPVVHKQHVAAGVEDTGQGCAWSNAGQQGDSDKQPTTTYIRNNNQQRQEHHHQRQQYQQY